VKIYTRTGDDGTTGLFGGTRVGKDDARVDAYGSVDSTNAAIGMALCTGLPGESAATLRAVQEMLFSLGAELACAPGKASVASLGLVTLADAEGLEREMDRLSESLPPLRNFILPGGTPSAAALHVARTTCRDAERRLVRLQKAEPVRKEPLIYLNRLSDLLFLMAREANLAKGHADVEWKPRS
jgi:cob(I)alamin adenosyltransferase